MTRAARSSLHVLRRKCRGRKRGPEAENRHGGAPRGAPPSSRSRMYPTSATHRVPNSGNPSSGGRQAPSQGAWPAALLQVAGARWHPSACRRSAHPSVGVDKAKARAQSRRENETGCLTSLVVVARIRLRAKAGFSGQVGLRHAGGSGVRDDSVPRRVRSGLPPRVALGANALAGPAYLLGRLGCLTVSLPRLGR